MPKITAGAPVLLVSDVVASANYFRDAVGFTYDKFYGEPPHFCIAQRDGHYVMLAKVDDPRQIKPNWKIVHQMWNAYFWVDDAKALFDELVASGAKIDYDLGVKPYGILEFGIQDLDGHDIGFGQRIA
jgi:predicted lactoylglutathione lyase